MIRKTEVQWYNTWQRAGDRVPSWQIHQEIFANLLGKEMDKKKKRMTILKGKEENVKWYRKVSK